MSRWQGLALGLCNHLAGVSFGLIGDRESAQHTGDLFHPGLGLQRCDSGLGLVPAAVLGHQQMIMALRCHLGQVGDAEYLAVGAKPPQ